MLELKISVFVEKTCQIFVRCLQYFCNFGVFKAKVKKWLLL